MTGIAVKEYIFTLAFVLLLGCLYFVWAPMMDRDHDVNLDKVLEESRATIGRVESELKRIEIENKRVGSELRKLPSEESHSP